MGLCPTLFLKKGRKNVRAVVMAGKVLEYSRANHVFKLKLRHQKVAVVVIAAVEVEKHSLGLDGGDLDTYEFLK